MKEESTATEQKILDAAKRVFIQKGMSGARMQEIADEADINKSLLHYYYRSKDKLFEAVFKNALADFFPSISNVFFQDIPLPDKIKLFTQGYIAMFQKNPFIPGFVLSELNRDPARLISIFKEMIGSVSTKLLPMLSSTLQDEKSTNDGLNMKLTDLVVDIIGLCIFPFIGRPLIQEILFNGNEKQYAEFLENRAAHISLLIDKFTMDYLKNN